MIWYAYMTPLQRCSNRRSDINKSAAILWDVGLLHNRSQQKRPLSPNRIVP